MTDLTPAPGGYPIKLVRDKTTDVIGNSGILFYDNMLPGPAREEWLRKKLGEEVTEFLVHPEVDELADVLAVVEALANGFGVNMNRLLHLSRTDQRGGFMEGRMMRGYHAEYDGKK